MIIDEKMENSTTDSNITTAPSHLPNSNNNSLLAIQLICYAAIIIVGTFGNILIFISLVFKKKRKTSDYFIVNLTITDLLCCIISIPFDIMEVTLGYWPLGLFMCKIVYPLQTILSAVSVGTLLFMALERHRAIMHPLKPKIRGKYALLTIAVVWVSAIGLVTPYMLTLRLNGSQCIENWPGELYVKAFTVCVLGLLYVLPLSIIIAAYIRIARRLRTGNHTIDNAFSESLIGRRLIAERRKRNMRVLKIFVSAVVAFAICFLPYNVMWLWYDFGNAKNFTYFYDLLQFANMLVYSNSAINPFIFGALSQKFRTCICRTFLRKPSINKRKNRSNGYKKITLWRNAFRLKPSNPPRTDTDNLESRKQNQIKDTPVINNHMIVTSL